MSGDILAAAPCLSRVQVTSLRWDSREEEGQVQWLLKLSGDPSPGREKGARHLLPVLQGSDLPPLPCSLCSLTAQLPPLCMPGGYHSNWLCCNASQNQGSVSHGHVARGHHVPLWPNLDTPRSGQSTDHCMAWPQLPGWGRVVFTCETVACQSFLAGQGVPRSICRP